jgi:hypothetical protein
MTRKNLTIIALGWTACTAAAFWAGTHWTREGDGGTEKSRRQGGAQSALAVAESQTLHAVRRGDRAAGAFGAAAAADRKAISELTVDETKARMKDILAMEDPLARMEAYLEFIKGVKGDEQIAAAMESLTENYNGRERSREFSMFMTRWARESPEAALTWTQKHDDWRSQWGTQTVLAVLAQTNPDRAIEWSLAHAPKNKEEGNYHLVAAIGSIAKFDIDRAAQLAQGMDRSEARGHAMDRVLDQYFKQRGADAATSMVMSLDEGPYKNGIIGRLAERLADKDPKAAAAWAASLPAGEAKPRVVTEVIDEWAERSPNEAATWLDGMPRDASMDEPRERFAWKVQERDPEAALAWAGTITDVKRRNEASYRLVRGWMEREPDNARAWIATSQLPPEMKERLMNQRRG